VYLTPPLKRFPLELGKDTKVKNKLERSRYQMVEKVLRWV